MSFHTFVEKVFNKSPEECKYAKKMIGQFRKRVTSYPSHPRPRLLCLPSALPSGCLLERRLCERTGFRVALSHAWCMDYVLELVLDEPRIRCNMDTVWNL